MKHSICKKCPFRAQYDKNPNSLIGRFWYWHIKFCPGWKIYYKSLPQKDQSALREKYKRGCPVL